MRRFFREFIRLFAVLLITAAFGALVVGIIRGIGETAITAYATVFLALVTAALAGYTAILASDTRQASQLADRHHQESQNPILTATKVVGSHSIVFNPPGGSLSYAEAPPENGARRNVVTAEVAIQNVGHGPALRVQYRVVFPEADGVKSFPSDNEGEFEPLGSIYQGAPDTVRATVRYGDDVHGIIVTYQERTAFVMNIRYFNVFGAMGTVDIRYSGEDYASEEVPPGAVTRPLPVVHEL